LNALRKHWKGRTEMVPDKALQAIPINNIGICDRRTAVLCGMEAGGRHNAVVAGASAPPVPACRDA
jgi:hypothetical protein